LKKGLTLEVESFGTECVVNARRGLPQLFDLLNITRGSGSDVHVVSIVESSTIAWTSHTTLA
jgi:hypothetical protein